MPKRTLKSSTGEFILEFDDQKENPELFELMNSGVNLINKMQSSVSDISDIKIGIISSTFGIVHKLSQIRQSENIVKDLYTENMDEIVLKLKNFINFPKISAPAAFHNQFLIESLAKCRLISDDIERTYSIILNQCIALRVDLLANFSLCLAILSVILGGIGIFIGIQKG